MSEHFDPETASDDEIEAAEHFHDPSEAETTRFILDDILSEGGTMDARFTFDGLIIEAKHVDPRLFNSVTFCEASWGVVAALKGWKKKEPEATNAE